MPSSFKQFGLNAISGEDRSLIASIARGVAGSIEPFYSAAMSIRNRCYDRGIFASNFLGRPTICVGNLTTGGTGKTPVVRWLAEQLRAHGRRPAILLRGYGSAANGTSDEAHLLDRTLNIEGQPPIPVEACPSRIDAAGRVLQRHPDVDVFLLDDGLQHRRARRDFNLVLISATNPFGYGHVLPRGLLREPLSGLRRADAFLVTRSSLVTTQARADIDGFLTDRHPTIPIFHCDHRHTGLWLPMQNQNVPMNALVGENVFLAAAIGDPASFRRQIELNGCKIAGESWFEDHHAFDHGDVDGLLDALNASGADRLIVTRKDWVKLAPLMKDRPVAVAVVELKIDFQDGDEQALLARVQRAIERDVNK